MNNLSQLTGKVYPDKSFTIGILPRAKAKSQDRAWIRSLREVIDGRTVGLTDWLIGTATIGGKFCSLNENPVKTEHKYELRKISNHDLEVYREIEKLQYADYSNFYDCESPDETPLFIESLKSSRKKRKPYGEHGITNYGKRVVKNGALLLEKKYGKSRLGFVTCTLPGISIEKCREVIAKWSEISRRFYQKVKRQLEKVSQPFIYTGVTEIQEKRFKRSGIAAPHIHFVYLCRSSARGQYWIFICQLHRAWNESLGECVTGIGYDSPGNDCRYMGSVHAKSVRKSATAYLGKYISKGCKVVESMKEKGYKEFPRQWWTACMQTKKMFKESIIKIPLHVCKQLFYLSKSLLEAQYISNYSYVTVNIAGDERTMGMAGTLTSVGITHLLL